MCQPGVHANCDKEQHTAFSALLFFSLFFPPFSLREKQVLAWIRKELHHLKRRGGMERREKNRGKNGN